jgi:hypothetical protein
MIVNFRAREISRGVHKLIQTPTSIKKNNAIYEYNFNIYSKGVRQVIYLFNVEEMVLMRSQDENRYRENKIK